MSALSGTGGGGPDLPRVRGFSDPFVGHSAVFRPVGTSDIQRANGTPFGTPVGIGGGLLERSNPWGYRRHDGVAALLYADIFQHVHEVTPAAGNVDLFNAYGLNAPKVLFPVIGPTPDVIGYVRSDNRSAIVYNGANNHIIELKSNLGSQPPWLVTDLTLASAASVSALAGSAFPYVRSDGCNTVVYRAGDNHLHELASFDGVAWGDADLSVASGDLTTPYTDPWGYKRSDGYNTVLFVDVNNSLHELAYYPGGHWGTAILPASSPQFGLDARPSGYIRADGVNAVVYVSVSNSVRELRLTSNGWIDSLLPTPSVTPKGELFGHPAPGNRSSVLFQGTNAGVNHRYELSQPVGGQWGLQAF